MNPSVFWSFWEEIANSYFEVQEKIIEIDSTREAGDRVFAWRGSVNADWALHSSLYRRLLWTKRSTPNERDLYEQEGDILASVHRWGLHFRERGRMPILAQLATLQHYGAPTRLIDVTFNPWVALWFAVEKKWRNGAEVNAEHDGRLFAFDITDRLINESDDRVWEDSLSRPWPSPAAQGDELDSYRRWQTTTYAWKPPHFDPRIAAQNGGFLLGGVPATKKEGGSIMYWPKSGSPKAKRWPVEDVRKSTSLALRAHRLHEGRSSTTNAVYTVRVGSNAKEEIRRRLETLYGYNHATIYPDYSGFASFGTPHLRESP